MLTGSSENFQRRAQRNSRAGVTVAIVLAVLALAAVIYSHFSTPQFAYVDTARLIVGFSEAAKVERELKAEDDKWRARLKTLQDSLQSSIDTMSKYFDTAKPTRKRELQDALSAWNQRVNNFRMANEKRMQKLHTEKMKGVLDKINVYLREFGAEKGYAIVFGTAAGGSILYGEASTYDITDAVVKGLNERYK